MARQVTQCPVCDADLRITELTCATCSTKLHGDFPPAPLARLSREHQQFIETFLRCRGVIRDVERMLGISYPTVRARLDAAVTALESAIVEDQRQSAATAATQREAAAALPLPPTVPSLPTTGAQDRRRRDLLRRVADGSLDPADAADALRSL